MVWTGGIRERLTETPALHRPQKTQLPLVKLAGEWCTVDVGTRKGSCHQGPPGICSHGMQVGGGKSDLLGAEDEGKESWWLSVKIIRHQTKRRQDIWVATIWRYLDQINTIESE